MVRHISDLVLDTEQGSGGSSLLRAEPPGYSCPLCDSRGISVNLCADALVAAVSTPPRNSATSICRRSRRRLADIRAVHFHNYYVSKLWGVEGENANAFWIRAAMPTVPVVSRRRSRSCSGPGSPPSATSNFWAPT